MCRYPDADKLIFFGDPADHDSSSSHCDDDDDDMISEEDDSAEYADLMAMISAQRQAYANLLAVPYARPLIQGMLNWSVRNRLSTSEVCRIACFGTQMQKGNFLTKHHGHGNKGTKRTYH